MDDNEEKSPSDDKGADFQASELGLSTRNSVSEGVAISVPPKLSEYGTSRGLESHHLQLLAISGVIGSGLFVGTSSVLVGAGPAGLFIGYVLWCGFVICVAHAQGEMSAMLPIPGSFAAHMGRFLDESIGVAMGWCYTYAVMMQTAGDATACVLLWSLWFPDVNPGVWVAVTLVPVFSLNCFGVRFFGEVEFWASILKVILILGFLIFTFVAVLGGNPHHDRIGFRYWNNPGAFNEQYTAGSLGRFCAIWGVFNTAAFSIGGPEFIANCANEVVNPRRNIPKAVKRVMWRLILFFVLSVLAVGMLVPSNDPSMLAGIAAGGRGIAKSPFIIAVKRLDIPFLPNLINAIIISSAWSCTNCLLYSSARNLFGLAKLGRAPKIFAKTTKQGVPLPALILSGLVACLAFMTCNNKGSEVFSWFVNLAATAMMIGYLLMMWSNLRFHKGLKAQGIDPATLPFRSPLVPYSNYIGIFGIGIVLLTNGFGVFIHGYWSFANFFSAYFSIVFFLVIWAGWKLWKRTPWIKTEDMDFTTGIAEVEAHEATLVQKIPDTRYERFLDWLW